ncbi:MAG: phosphatase PAP2 family protein [Gammaproteobacteria bacterium]|nr:phosphatase PAP2 family protein [Gammaproteobacteria bacterium]
MTDGFAHFFLFFNHWPFMGCLLAFGLIFGNRTLFYHTLCIVSLSIILNVTLKVTFQIPLSPTLHKAGFAFPSGHMQLAVVLYGWIALHLKHRTLQALIIGLLTGIAFGIVHFGYHTWFDILGGVFFAGLILGLYQALLLQKVRYFIWIHLFMTTLAMSYIDYRYTIPMHAWIAYGALLSLVIVDCQKVCAQTRS